MISHVNSLQPHGLQHARLPCPSLSPEFAQTHVHWVGDAIQPSHPLSPSSPHTLNLSQHLFQWVSSLPPVAKVLALQLWHQSFQWTFRVDFLDDWLVWTPCCPRYSQESSAAPQFRSMNSLVLSLLYSQTLTSIVDYYKAIAMTICTSVGKVMSLLFNMLSKKKNMMSSLCHSFSFKEWASFIFMAVVTICTDFGAQENKMYGLLILLF